MPWICWIDCHIAVDQVRDSVLGPARSHVGGLVHARIAREISNLVVRRVDCNSVDAVWLMLLRDLVLDRSWPGVRILRHENCVVVGDCVNDVRVVRSFNGSRDRVPHGARAGRCKGAVSDRGPNYRRSRSIQSADHALASGHEMFWRERVHAEGREKVAGTIVIKLGRANRLLQPWRCSRSRSGNSPNVLMLRVCRIHREIGDPAICRINEVMGRITAMDAIPPPAPWHQSVTEDNAVILGSCNHGAIAA